MKKNKALYRVKLFAPDVGEQHSRMPCAPLIPRHGNAHGCHHRRVRPIQGHFCEPDDSISCSNGVGVHDHPTRRSSSAHRSAPSFRRPQHEVSISTHTLCRCVLYLARLCGLSMLSSTTSYIVVQHALVDHKGDKA